MGQKGQKSAPPAEYSALRTSHPPRDPNVLTPTCTRHLLPPGPLAPSIPHLAAFLESPEEGVSLRPRAPSAPLATPSMLLHNSSPPPPEQHRLGLPPPSRRGGVTSAHSVPLQENAFPHSRTPNSNTVTLPQSSKG